jgi:hypothetical protein
MGNVQRLDNGNTVIGWGAIPGVTEVRPDGSKAIVLYLSGSPYRAFRFPWDGIPAEPPRAAAMGTGNPAMVTLYFGWNGATQIDAYEVYAGPTSSQMTLLSTVDRTGFETSTTLTGLPQGTCVFKVRPVDHLGRSTPYSNTAYRTDIAACRNLIPRMYLPLVLE